MRSSIYMIFLALIMASCNSAEKSLKKGDIAYALGEYSDAAAHYKKAYSRYAPKEREQRVHTKTLSATSIPIRSLIFMRAR